MSWNYKITTYIPEEEDLDDYDKNDIIRCFKKQDSLMKFITITLLSGRKYFVEYKDPSMDLGLPGES